MQRIVWLGVVLMAAMPAAFGQKTVVIANRSAHITEMSAADVREIFTGAATHFHNGTQAVPVLLRGGPEHEAFLLEFVGKQDSSFRTSWRTLVFTGVASMPRTVDEDQAMLAYVANTPGAIGYVSKAAVRDNVVTVTVR